ncbi:hypothetical protein DSO57_1009396 [Entomophthora muscae]|uniref:Uncharacterized protein n=1 Tax=Entomophthora muscae TaxID=34485 RepID=A0ACC2T6W9_9FUNG|nr:hypothetical protein DSO57_1009396 [Entomophthora muscae]
MCRNLWDRGQVRWSSAWRSFGRQSKFCLTISILTSPLMVSRPTFHLLRHIYFRTLRSSLFPSLGVIS